MPHVVMKDYPHYLTKYEDKVTSNSLVNWKKFGSAA